MDKYAVFGHPIAQSKSPFIHSHFAKQTGQQLDYQAILAPVDGFSQALDDFFADPNAKGCNITMPFKEEAAKWVDELSPEAKLVGSVNTIIRQQNGKFLGDTTDGYGLVLDLHNHGIELEGARILLIGAGGAARGVLLPLLNCGPASLTIANRTQNKAQTLKELVASSKLHVTSLSNQQNEQYDIIINSTSASLSGQQPGLPDATIATADTVYDMVYKAQPTVFMKHAKDLGVKNAIDGLGMLVGQAAQSFYLWREVKPDIGMVLEKLRAEL